MEAATKGETEDPKDQGLLQSNSTENTGGSNEEEQNNGVPETPRTPSEKETKIVSHDSPPPTPPISNVTETNAVADADPEGSDKPPQESTTKRSMGATIIMNRFSSWRQQANENAQILLKKAQEQAKTLEVPAVVKPLSFRSTEGATPGEDTQPSSENESHSSSSGIEDGNEDDVETAEVEGPATLDEPGPPVSARTLAANLPELASTAKSMATGVVEQVRASGVVDSVATVYRGRYAADEKKEAQPSAPPTPMSPRRESQTALILKSRAASHLQAILDSLSDYQYVLLLGPGRLDVNLKQTYLKHHGVYIDYLVAGGQAERSGIVYVGDTMVKVGEIDVRKGTISDVPSTIAAAKRPAVLVLSTGMELALERINYVDIAVALLHRFQEQRQADLDQPSVEKDDTDVSNKASEEAAAKKFEEIRIPMYRSVDAYVSPPIPSLDAKKALYNWIGKRNNEPFSVTELSELVAKDTNFRAALRNAFLSCVADSRKYRFLGRHLALEKNARNEPVPKPDDKTTPNELVMLVLELMTFSDMHGITPESKRRSVASDIAKKYFLPTRGEAENELEPPVFDCHHIVPGTVLQDLETVLNNPNSTIPQDLFIEFQHAAVDVLCGQTFLLFLVSNDCARMRSYLRNTAPIVNIPFREIFDRLVADVTVISPAAKNVCLFVLIFLVQLENDGSLALKEEVVFGKNGKRIVGATGGICCAIFLRKFIVPLGRKFNAPSNEAESNDRPDPATIVQAFNHLWEVFVAPGIGAVEMAFKSKDTNLYLEKLRAYFRETRAAVFANKSQSEQERNQAIAERLTKPAVLEVAQNLVDYLLYDFGSQSYVKFREHLYHEWLCQDIAKASTTFDKSEKASRLPMLTNGCVKSLLRKVDFPVGVSGHKPIHSKSPKTETPDIKASASNPNASCAVIFGTAVGAELISQMMSPAMDHSDIRRYCCHELSMGKTPLPDSFVDQLIPPTLESYAVLPPSRSTPFTKITENVSLSLDGWEVSLVNFMIPKAGSSDHEGKPASLYGVSLVFRRSSTAKFHPRKVTQTQLVYSDEKAQNEEPNASGKDFVSPISISTPKDNHWSNFTRSVQVSAKTPIFNEKLRNEAWVDRVLQDESRDQDSPATVGIALVSDRNFIVSMRETLQLLLRDYCRLPDGTYSDRSGPIVGGLVDLLGNFAYQDVEKETLKSILMPYLRFTSRPWLERPIDSQKEAFERHAGEQLIASLPPIPLALLLVAALLEQKIVFSSSRRSILYAATSALTGMMEPLTWCHLLVPLVPSALAKDLLQYPAPFILGLPSEDPGVMELLSDLPDDVTLVDLDVGRVILAPRFARERDNSSESEEENPEDINSELRSQVLYLAQILGCVFGSQISRECWSCDSPSISINSSPEETNLDGSLYERLRRVCRSFLDELLAGLPSCCLWIEEAIADEQSGASSQSSTGVCSVLLDEDRFYCIKEYRQDHGFESFLEEQKDLRLGQKVTVSAESFNLVLETLLRCQSLNIYISSLPKETMLFYL